MRRALKLKDGKQFAKVYTGGKSTGNKFLVLYYLYQQDSGEPTKVGFSISKKVGSAVVRNKLKRQLGAIITENFNEIKPCYLLVYIVKRSARELDYQQLKEAALSLLNKSGIVGGAQCA